MHAEEIRELVAIDEPPSALVRRRRRSGLGRLCRW
jgi:hypothetical protein